MIEILNETVQNQHQNRLNKLKNKRSQLENLLRSRERLDYEIKNLQRSLARDQKKLIKEQNLWCKHKDREEILTESKLIGEGEDPDDLREEVLQYLHLSSVVLDEVLELLLKFSESSVEH